MVVLVVNLVLSVVFPNVRGLTRRDALFLLEVRPRGHSQSFACRANPRQPMG
jgi:hypothetical protein